MSHAGGLRDQWLEDDAAFLETVRGLIAFGHRVPDLAPRQACEAFAAHALPGLPAEDRPLVDFVARITLLPRSVEPRHLDAFRSVGWSDLELHDAVQVAALFAHMNRLADALGVGVEPRKVSLAVELYGERALADHQAWARPRD